MTYLHAPSIVDSAALCDALLADRSVQAALATAARSEIALVGIGDITPTRRSSRPAISSAMTSASSWPRVRSGA